MNRIQRVILIIVIATITTGVAVAQKNKLITVNSVGPLKIGMSIAKARRAARPLVVSKGSPGFEGEVEYSVRSGKKRVIDFIYYFGKITSIEVWDPGFKTSDGVHVGMKLGDLERIYGKLKGIRIGEQDDFEYAVFTNHPKGLFLRVSVPGKGKRAGVYSKDSMSTTEFNSGIYLSSIQTYGGGISEEAF